MKLLLVDDEIYAREGIREGIEWRAFGITEIMEAENGEEGLEISKWFQPDIALTDIRMPKIDGIEFAEEFCRICPESRIIFITAYMDIQYMKKAIQLSAVDFIEKPIVIEEVENAISKSVEALKKEKSQKTVSESNRWLQQQKLANLLKYTMKGSDMLKQLCLETGFPTDGNYICIICFFSGKEEADVERVKELTLFWKRNHYGVAVSRQEEDEYVCMIEMNGRTTKDLKGDLDFLLHQMPDVRAALGNEVGSLFQLSTSFKNAMTARRRFFYRPKERVFHADGMAMTDQTMDAGIYLKLNEVFNQTPERLPEHLDTVFEEFGRMEYLRKEHIQIFACSFANRIIKYNPQIAEQMNLDSAENKGIEAYFERCGSLYELRDALKEVVYQYLAVRGSEERYTAFTRKVMHFIAENYMREDFGLQEIADHFHLSINYLGWMFKKETGMTLRKCIEDYRINQAKEKLMNGYCRVGEIAEQCGFASSNYFSRVFREATGMTPNEYRNSRREG